MTDYLLDTNHASRLLAGADPITGRVKALAGGEHHFGISVTVLGELYFAAYASQRRAENLQALRAFLDDIILWPFDSLVAEEFGRIMAEQKAKGRPIPPLDVQIAAVARRYHLVLLTADRHFAFVTGVVIENWLA